MEYLIEKTVKEMLKDQLYLEALQYAEPTDESVTVVRLTLWFGEDVLSEQNLWIKSK